MSAELTAAQAEEFFEIGFTIVREVFTADEIAAMRAAFDRLRAMAEALGESQMHNGSQFVVERIPAGPAAGQLAIRRISWCGAAEPVLSEYGKDARLLRMASRLLGSSEMNQLINQAHFKLPDDDVQFPWHQDSQHRGYGTDGWRDVNGRGSYVQTATAIDDVTADNGPVLFIPGSCKRGHLGLPSSYDEQIESELFDAAAAVPALMQAGDVAVFGPYTVHGSLPNRSSAPRRVFINGFAFPGANSRVYPGDGAGRMLRTVQSERID